MASQPRVHMLPADPHRPLDAAHAVTIASLRGLPRRRPVTVAMVGFSAAPGLSVAPWTLRGVDDAIVDSGRSREDLALLGQASGARSLLGPWLRLDRTGVDANAVVRGLRGERRLVMQVPGSRRRARVPKGFVGSSLLLVAPLVHRQWGAGRTAVVLGPTCSAFASVAEYCGLEGSPAALVAAGQRLVSDVFCGVVVVVDATWWVTVAQEGSDRAPFTPRSELVAPEHVLAVSEITRPADLRTVDAWLSELLGLGRGRGGSRSSVRIAGKRNPWPDAQLPEPARGGMAGRAVEALWQARRRHAREGAKGIKGVLGPAVPGRFSSVWSSSPERSLLEGPR